MRAEKKKAKRQRQQKERQTYARALQGMSPRLKSRAHAARLRAKSASTPIQDRAVTVEWLTEFANRNNAWLLPTWKVVDNFVKPHTLSRLCRYVELPGVVDDSNVGRVDTLLSHYWSNSFGDLVAAARHESRRGRRVWVDIFAVNQHSSNTQNGDDVLGLETALRAARDGVMLVVDARRALTNTLCNPMLRVWCVEEIRITLDAGLPLIVKCGRADRTAGAWPRPFVEECDQHQMTELVRSISIGKARAKFPADQQMILSRIALDPTNGYGPMNELIRKAMKTAFMGRGLSAWNFVVQGERAVHEALAGGQLTTDSIEDATMDGNTALHVAVQCASPRRHEYVRVLLEAGASVEHRDRHGRTPACLAVHHANFEGLQLLHQHGACLNARETNGNSLLHVLRARLGKKHARDARRRPTHAEESLLTQMAAWALEHGAIAVCNNRGCTFCEVKCTQSIGRKDCRCLWCTTTRDLEGSEALPGFKNVKPLGLISR